MKFSILVPVYNVEKYIEQCVESLLSQTYTGEYEIILVDDGSTDSSRQICDNYAQQYPDKIKVIHKTNQGLISARDAGIKVATGEYCLFVDSDDFVELDLLQIVNAAIEDNNLPDMVIYSFRYYENGAYKNRKMNIPDKLFSESEKDYFYEQLISTPTYSSVWSKAVKTELLKSDPNDYSKYYGKNMGEDWLRSIHIFTAVKSVVCLNKPLYNYRTNLNSISKSFSVDAINKFNMLHVYEQFMKYLPQWGMDDTGHLNQLKNRWMNETIYTFSNFYEGAKDNLERKQIVGFLWDSFLPNDFVVDDLTETNKVNVLLYKKIKEKDYDFLKRYFLKKKVYKKYKTIKARLKR